MSKKAVKVTPPPEPQPLNSSLAFNSWSSHGRPINPQILASMFSLICDLELRVRTLEARRKRQ